MSVSRIYKSPLREEQMEQTRDRILEQVAEILASDTPIDLTVAEAAARARVSVRTAYRYFPTRDALIDGFNAWMANRFAGVEFPKTLDALRPYVASLYKAFTANERLVRASRSSQSGADIRKRRKAIQAKSIMRMVTTAAPNLEPAIQRRRAAALHDAIGSDAFIHMRDTWDLTGDECIEAADWALDALITKLHKDNQAAAKAKR